MLVAGPAGNDAGTEPQPCVRIEASRFTLPNAEAHRTLKAPSAQHSRGSQRLGKAAPIPRHTPRHSANCPADLLRSAYLLGGR